MAHPHPLKTLYHLGLGGNLGDVAATMRQAIALLNDAAGTVTQSSALYSTVPMGADAGTGYRNAAIALLSNRLPRELLAITQQVEQDCGRERHIHWGPRTLDIDLLLAGPARVETPALTVPHPGLGYRRFALDPLVEIAPETRHPLWNIPLCEIQTALGRRPLPIAVRTSSPASQESLVERLPDPLRRQIDLRPAVADHDASGRWVIDLTASSPSGTPFHLPLQGVTSLDRLGEVLSAMLDEPRRVGTLFVP